MTARQMQLVDAEIRRHLSLALATDNDVMKRSHMEVAEALTAAAAGGRGEGNPVDNIQIGAPYRFVPSAFVGEKSGMLPGKKELPRSVTGRICYINQAHRFFQVAYEINGYHLTESFKF